MATRFLKRKSLHRPELPRLYILLSVVLQANTTITMLNILRYITANRITVASILVLSGVFFSTWKVLDSKWCSYSMDVTTKYIRQHDRLSSSSMYSHLHKDTMKGLGDENTIRDISGGWEFKPTDRFCAEERHIYYIKLHKTGSGTLSNIFLRFGLSRNLSFAIPKERTYFPLKKLEITDIKPLSKTYDMLIHHSYINPKIKRRVFDRDVITVVSLRQPFSLFVSSYYFFRFRKSIPTNISTEGSEVAHLEQYITFMHNKTLNDTVGNRDMNKLSLELGVPLSRSRDKGYVKNFVQTVLAKEIDFVTIQGYFDHSLVLLKRKFCWQTKDILYRGLHVTSRIHPTFREISHNVRSQFMELMPAEHIIFDFFERKLLKAFWEEGSGFFDEVRDFRITLQVVADFCNGNPVGEEVKVIPRSRWNNQFRVTGSDCHDMRLRDGTGIEKILERRKKKKH